ncbi:sulfatase-like hydrolase/transferase, partial [Pseudoalteromonas sp. GW168-MNA-CIBAN-0100]
YSRATNTYTPKLGVKYFSDVSSCGTATAISVPCMFSRLNRKEYDSRLASSQENALDIIQRSGVEVTWIDNNSSCKGVCA